MLWPFQQRMPWLSVVLPHSESPKALKGRQHAPAPRHSIPRPSLPLLPQYFELTESNVMGPQYFKTVKEDRTSGMNVTAPKVGKYLAVCSMKRIESWNHGKGVR